jgi:hypothetical protein
VRGPGLKGSGPLTKHISERRKDASEEYPT